MIEENVTCLRHAHHDLSNFDVVGGVVNGCQGILRHIRYRIDMQICCHTMSYVIEASIVMSPTMPQL